MFYLAHIEDYVRVEPRLFGLETREAVEKQLNETYVDKVSKEIGFVMSVVSVDFVGDGVIIPGDGATYYKSRFTVLVWRPDLHELTYGTIEEITNFGAFIRVGPARGMIHISQTMDDYVSLSKTGTLAGKNSKRVISVGDKCLARVVAISYKMGDPKIGLTMRQPGLGKIEWLDEQRKKSERVKKEGSKDAGKKSKKGGKK
ncbi:MAG: DNA-directed RNA polymerase [Nanoarchaeota archaeon]